MTGLEAAASLNSVAGAARVWQAIMIPCGVLVHRNARTSQIIPSIYAVDADRKSRADEGEISMYSVTELRKGYS